MKSLQELAARDRYNAAGDFVTMAHLLLRSNGRRDDAARMAEQTKNISPRVINVLKEAGTLSTLGGLVDQDIVAAGFIDSLRSIGVFDGMLPAMVKVPLETPGVRVTTIGISAYAVAEGSPKPISELFLGAETLDRLKADAIIVVSDEIAKSTTSGAAALLARELRNAVVAETDGLFLSVLAIGPQPVASAGATLANVETDIRTAMAAMSLHGGSRLFLIAAPLAAQRLRLKLALAGATLDPVTLIASDQLPALGSPDEDIAMLIDASGIAANTPQVVLDTAEHAAIQLSSSPSAGAQNLVSLWQANSRALRASRYFGFTVFRADAAQVISGVAW